MPPTNENAWTEPTEDWERLSEAARERTLRDLEAIGFNMLKDNWRTLEAFFADEAGIKGGAALGAEYNNIFLALAARQDLLANAVKYFPKLQSLYDEWIKFLTLVQKANEERANDPNADAAGRSIQDYLEAFSNGGATKFTWAGDFMTTQGHISEWLNRNQRPETEAYPTLPYQLRLGGSRFFVPPINIQVSTTFRSGGLTGSAIRQASSPKFNSGHSDTTISMTLYFPNQESIWGFDGMKEDIDFDKDPDEKIDKFMSSLRGLIAQFRYSPILPIRNAYLNRTYGITAVALQGMTVQTIPNYPFCVAVNLELLNFNHKVFLPMINDFNQAVMWGRFRQYMGRAAQKMNSYTNQGFLMETVKSDGTSLVDYEGQPTETFDKNRDMGGELNEGFFGVVTNYSGVNPNKFSIYYPASTPAKVYAPDTSGWRQPGENTAVGDEESLWASFLGALGYDLASNSEAIYEYMKNYDQANSSQIGGGIRIQNLIVDYLDQLGTTVDGMNDERMDAFIDDQINKRREEFHGAYSADQEREDRHAFREAWFFYMFTNHTQGPLYKKYQEQLEAKKKLLIKEWDVPMELLEVNWKKVIVNGVSVSLGNNFARHQLQMQAEPSLQHIGGRDSSCSVSMTVFGEDELIRLKRVFDHISGLARLEHAHGVLGFLGIKNTLTSLCGMKYVIPLTFEADTIPNAPHVYSVRLDMVDFDVFQQKREELSNEQQAEFIEAFGKRNPFLRIKQLWSAFNAYPDFPLAIYDEVKGDDGKTKRKVIGHLDPDFYFKAFQTIDDDLVNQNLENRPTRTNDLNTWDTSAHSVVEPGTVFRKDADGKYRRVHPSAVDAQLDTNAESEPTTLPGNFYRSQELNMKVTFPVMGENQDKMSGVSIRQGDVALGEVDMETGQLAIKSADPNNPMAGYGTVRDDHAAQSVTLPTTEGLTPHSAWGQPTVQATGKTNGANDPMYQVEKMMEDTQYRDNSGRMIRAYPTYMLWLIDEGGTFAGVKLFDNFYGLQSVIDFSVHQSEDVLGDTLILRLSNLYSKLNSQSSALIKVGENGERENLGISITDILADPYDADEAIDRMLITRLAQGQENLRLGTEDEYIRELSGIRLKPGIRVHLRMGYSANPNSLDTVFNGTITQVTNGDIVEVVAQGDGIELAPYINTTDKGGHSGKIDGALNTGLWLSEPRDLMVRLLSMGSSTFRESFAHATEGLIFSENKFGIRHFGSILYEEITEGEKTRQQAQQDNVESALNFATGENTAGVATGGLGIIGKVAEASFDNVTGSETNSRAGVAQLMTSLWTNSFKHRDYEIFKRNIYPGNGSGVGQYLGGDFPEAGILIAEAAGSDGGASGIFAAPTSTVFRSGVAADRGKLAETDTQKEGEEKEGILDNELTNLIPGVAQAKTAKSGIDMFKGIFNGDLNQNPIFTALGITSETESDLYGFDEVSFRAQTYMKSVWDMFKVCAQLLPNYIVAVRPFEDRSTVFYGKPHWLYTSGLIPITTGVPKGDTGIKPIGPDMEQQEILQKIRNEANPLADFQAQQKLFTSLDAVTQADPTASTAGLPGAVGSPTAGNTNQEKVWNYFVGKGMSPVHIAGIMGNIEAESSFNPDQEQIGGPAYGLVQWDDRRSKLEAKARELGVDVANIDFQLDYIWFEFEGSEHAAYVALLATTTPGDAAEVFCTKFERAGVPRMDLRREAADRYYEMYQGGTPTATAPAESAGDKPKNPTRDSTPGGAVVTTDEEVDRLVKGGFPREQATWFARGHVDQNVNIWSVGVNYEAYSANPDSEEVRNAANTDPVGHFARLMYDREYALRFKKFVEETGDNGAFLGETASKFMGIFKDLGALDAPYAGWSDHPTNGPGETLQLAEVIWDQFRNYWGMRGDDKYEVKKQIDSSGWGASEDYVIQNKSQDSGPADLFNGYDLADSEYLERASQDSDSRVSIWDDAGLAGAPIDDNFDYLPNMLVATFKKFMWQNPYARAWLIVTTDFHTSFLTPDSLISMVAEPVTDVIGAQGEVGLSLGVPFVGTWLGDRWAGVTESANSEELCDWVQSPVHEAWFQFLKITFNYTYPNGAKSDPIPFTEEELEQIKKDYVQQNPVGGRGVSEDLEKSAEFQAYKNSRQRRNPVSFNADWTRIADRNPDGSPTEQGQKLLKWMRDHDEPGKKSTNPADRRLNDVKELDGTIGKLLEVAGNTLQGLVTMMREQLSQIGLGLNMVGQMQQQAQIMNHVFNDSIYYAEGNYLADGKPDLLKMVDNPFTREYGEPVVEVREPFQRLHYIDSFRHIISNDLQENLSGVPTVVTASSDGKYPVSVYFDKGIASHLQNEVAIETGLFWDNAKGEGFFSFLHPLLNPIETMRGNSKIAQGSSDELLSKRVATAHLKEGLKDIYQGEIVVLGNADIRPHDLVYLADVYERTYGLFEVEAVTHHFTAETGFITSIVPNALVTANDPSRWAITKWISTLFGTKNLRDDTRHHLSVFADDTSIVKKNDYVTTADLAVALQHPILGHTSYEGGASAIVKDLVAAKATGLYVTETERMAHLQNLYDLGKRTDGEFGGTTTPFGIPVGIDPNNPNSIDQIEAAMGNNVPGVALMSGFVWDAWDWVRESLMDQHACYISYLTKDGQPMDAGLSYAQGVAVGRFHTISILPDILGVQTTYKENGTVRITTNDLLQALGWNEIDVAMAYKQTSLWVAETSADILSAAGKSPDGNLLTDNHLVSLCAVTEIEDGDTIHVRVLEGDLLTPNGFLDEEFTKPEDKGTVSLRLTGTRVFEMVDHDDPENNPTTDEGRRAYEYLSRMLPLGTHVAVRQNRDRPQDDWGRSLSVVFHSVPAGTAEEQKDDVLMGHAGRVRTGVDGAWSPGGVPGAPWDGYLDDGQPYTVNWHMIMAGYGDVDMFAVGRNDSDRGGSFGS